MLEMYSILFHNNFIMSRKDSQKNSRAQANLVSEAKAWHQRHAMAMRWPCDGHAMVRWAEMGIDACNAAFAMQRVFSPGISGITKFFPLEWSSWCGATKAELAKIHWRSIERST